MNSGKADGFSLKTDLSNVPLGSDEAKIVLRIFVRKISRPLYFALKVHVVDKRDACSLVKMPETWRERVKWLRHKAQIPGLEKLNDPW